MSVCMIKKHGFLVAAVCFLWVSTLTAQTTTTLFGNVTDKTGAVVPGATVTATNTGTNQARTVQTNAQGEYRLDFVPVGEYSLEVSAQGFKKFLQKGIVLEVNLPQRADASLDVGSQTEEVDVNATVPLVNTENAQLGRTVEHAELTTLPDREPQRLHPAAVDSGNQLQRQQHCAGLSRAAYHD